VTVALKDDSRVGTGRAFWAPNTNDASTGHCGNVAATTSAVCPSVHGGVLASEGDGDNPEHEDLASVVCCRVSDQRLQCGEAAVVVEPVEELLEFLGPRGGGRDPQVAMPNRHPGLELGGTRLLLLGAAVVVASSASGRLLMAAATAASPLLWSAAAVDVVVAVESVVNVHPRIHRHLCVDKTARAVICLSNPNLFAGRQLQLQAI